MIGNGCARQVVDEPSQGGVLLHPAQKPNNICVIKTMREERTDHKMSWNLRLEQKHVAADPGYPAIACAGLSSDDGRIGIQVDSRQLDGNVTCASPAFNAAQSGTVTAAHIENTDGLTRPRKSEAIEPLEQRPVGQHPLVHSRQTAKAGAQFLAAARLVHQFGELRTLKKIGRTRRHERAW